MKLSTAFASLALVLALSVTARADTKVEVKNTHLCCGMCVKAVGEILGKIDGVKGESKDKTHAKEIDLLSWSWGMSNNSSAHVGGEAEPAEVAFAGSATDGSQEADPQSAPADPLKKRPFWEDGTPRRALALGLMVLIGLGGYA